MRRGIPAPRVSARVVASFLFPCIGVVFAQAQTGISVTTWKAANPPEAIRKLMEADRMPALTAVATDGSASGKPTAKRLIAKQPKFPGIKFKDPRGGKAPVTLKPAKIKPGAKTPKSLFPSFKVSKTTGGEKKLVAQGGAKFKTQTGLKPSIKTRTSLKAKKQKVSPVKFTIKKDKSDRDPKFTLPRTQLAKFNEKVQSAKRRGTGKAKLVALGKLGDSPALVTKKTTIRSGQPASFEIKAIATN